MQTTDKAPLSPLTAQPSRLKDGIYHFSNTQQLRGRHETKQNLAWKM